MASLTTPSSSSSSSIFQYPSMPEHLLSPSPASCLLRRHRHIPRLFLLAHPSPSPSLLRFHPPRSRLSSIMIDPHKRDQVRIFPSLHDLSSSLAHYIAQLSDAAVKDRGSFAVALSGGSLIKTMGKLCEPPYLKTIDWSKWHVFWADERVVPRNHEDSNYKLAKDGLLSKVPILPGQVYSINDALSAEAAADDYEFGLRQLVKTRVVDVAKDSDCPRFDLILLGMGPDGHVASLFPGHPLTHEKDKWITFITDSPKPPPERITFTFPVINAAANVAMVLTGGNKAEVLEKTFGEELPPGVLPVQMVSPAEGKLVWFLDKDAASKLPELDH